jgi:hypothetical protein
VVQASASSSAQELALPMVRFICLFVGFMDFLAMRSRASHEKVYGESVAGFDTWAAIVDTHFLDHEKAQDRLQERVPCMALSNLLQDNSFIFSGLAQPLIIEWE